MNSKITYFFSGFVGVPLLGIFLFVTFQPIKVLPRMRLAPGFAVQTQGNKTLNSEHLRGHITLYHFAYSRCGAACQDAFNVLNAVQAQLQATDVGVPVRLVTLSLDAAHDTPGVLTTWGAQHAADPAQWLFATANTPEDARRVVGQGFGVFFRETAPGQFEFSQRMYLVDGTGLTRAEYTSFVPTPDRLMRDIRLVAEEARNSEGLGWYAYEAAHLFGCYAP